MKISHIFTAAALAFSAGGAHASKSAEPDNIFDLYDKKCSSEKSVWDAVHPTPCHAFSKTYLIQPGRENLVLSAIAACATSNLLTVEQCSEAERAGADLKKAGRLK
jgi:hypothetical protein